MEKIIAIRTYNLVNAKGTSLQLVLGRFERCQRERIIGPDQGFRWKFVGKEIPMPVRSNTWFNGFPECDMIVWLNVNDWYVHTSVDMLTGKAKVWDLPEAPEEYADYQMDLDAEEFNKHLKELCQNGDRSKAIRLYRYCHEVGTKTATQAVFDMCY